jgi:purine-binding chemotaxis protein CheW
MKGTGGSVTESDSVAISQCATFHVGDLYFGIDVQKVQEVLRFQETTRVPKAPPVIRGLINLRGQIVTAIDMRTRLGLPVRPLDSTPMNVVIRTAEGPLSLLVDEIGDVVEVCAEQFESAPANLPEPQRETLRGVFKLERELLLVLDEEKISQVNLG